ncbi:MAG: 3-deoxy-D-manno-octulosonic acid transferase [Acidobacteria bacterium]|nr:MAG: 3-deoxy-D-manno-octulosonic acid transferase [Acidobacteriota bacterium]
MLLAYSILVLLAALVVLPFYLLLELGSPETRRGWKERLGFVPCPPPSSAPRIWIQAVSVGEVQLARQLLVELRSFRPDLGALLTSTTAAGRKLALAADLPGTLVSAFPVDLPCCVGEALRRSRPDLVVLMETEIWPHLIRRCSRNGIRILVANGRISPQSFPRYRFFGTAMRELLRRVDRFLMQSEGDAGRILRLGAAPDRVEIAGNLKWDLPAPCEPAADIRRDLGLAPDAPVLVAGSTFQGEESLLLDAWTALRREFPTLGLVLAPRHPRRFERVAGLLAHRHIAFSRRSRSAGGFSPVLLLDTLGELRRVYGAGTLCFVGGSLVSRGGQNLIEPAAAGRPVIFGPRTENFSEAAAALLCSSGGFRISSSAELLAVARRLLSEPGLCEETGRRAAALVAKNRGATRRTAERILDHLPLRTS